MLVGLVGFAGAGKGTVGDVLVEKHSFKKFAFADTLKDTVSTMFGWRRDLLEGDTNESREFRENIDPFWSARFGEDVTPRMILQKMGTEAGRNVFHEDFWVHALEKRIQNEKNVVISDVRFPNEINFIRYSGGFIVRVSRGPEPEWYQTAYDQNINEKYSMKSKYPNVHVSEWAWIGTRFDYEINNDGTKVQLEAMTKHMLDIFRGPVNMQLSA
jgi:hypothetical protein